MRARAESERMRAGAAEGFDVHPDNVTAVRWLLAAATQWRMVSLSTMTRARLVRTGLDYTAAAEAARQSDLATTPDDFLRLRILEAEALIAWSEEAAAQR